MKNSTAEKLAQFALDTPRPGIQTGAPTSPKRVFLVATGQRTITLPRRGRKGGSAMRGTMPVSMSTQLPSVNARLTLLSSFCFDHHIWARLLTSSCSRDAARRSGMRFSLDARQRVQDAEHGQPSHPRRLRGQFPGPASA
jgi:hypothetical protein